MAINDHPDVRCDARRHPHGQEPQADGFLYKANSGFWVARCRPCIDKWDDALGPDFDPVPVVYLDPARQRRPQPDHDAPTDDHGHIPRPGEHHGDHPDQCPICTPAAFPAP